MLYLKTAVSIAHISEQKACLQRSRNVHIRIIKDFFERQGNRFEKPAVMGAQSY
jgi:hypothetical protein